MLLDALQKYAATDAVAMHMPGHKRNVVAFPWLGALGGALDITEIEGFDNLNLPQGLFRELEQSAAALWGAKESVCLVNGSTVGILASVRAVLIGGGALLLDRGSHRSLYHAAELAGAQTYYLLPPVHPDFGIRGAIAPQAVEKALCEHPDVRLVAVTSPTYEGVISDIQGIAEVCHAHGALLLVDEAHGAHLGFGDFPQNAIRYGADLAVQSLHKTLPSLTQTAILHMGDSAVTSGAIDPVNVRRNVVMLQTSSPSYLLSTSIDGCVDYLAREGNAAANRWLAALDGFRARTADLQKIRILPTDAKEGFAFAVDPSKIVISTSGLSVDGSNLSGVALAALLREEFSIELEMAAGSYALAMTGMGDTAATLSRLADALLAIDARCGKPSDPAPATAFSLPKKRLPATAALAAPGEFCPLPDAIGRISAEYVFAYPPGVPLLVPGEIVDKTVLRTIQTAVDGGENLHSTRESLPHRIFCVKES